MSVFDLVFWGACLGLGLVLVDALLPGLLGAPLRGLGNTILVVCLAVTVSLLAVMVGV